LNKKLKIWEDLYNLHRPHGAFNGKTPYEVLKEKISEEQNLLQFDSFLFEGGFTDVA